MNPPWSKTSVQQTPNATQEKETGPNGLESTPLEVMWTWLWRLPGTQWSDRRIFVYPCVCWQDYVKTAERILWTFSPINVWQWKIPISFWGADYESISTATTTRHMKNKTLDLLLGVTLIILHLISAKHQTSWPLAWGIPERCFKWRACLWLFHLTPVYQMLQSSDWHELELSFHVHRCALAWPPEH